MICPECETEYREGFTVCSDCDVKLVEALDQPALAPLTIETSPDLVGALLDALDTERIPFVIQAGTALSVLDGERETLDAPEPWHARIWVTPERAEEAQAILEEVRELVKPEGGPVIDPYTRATRNPLR